MPRVAVIPCPSNGINTKVGGHAGTTVETCSLPMQVKVVRYLVGGPSVLTAEDLARQDDEIARKTDGVMLSSEQVQKAHRNLVNVLRNAGCSKVLEIVRVSLGAGISMENLLVYMGVQRNAVRSVAISRLRFSRR